VRKGFLLPAALLALAHSAAGAQSLTAGRSDEKPAITVTGERPAPGAKPIPMSDWKVAETAHLLVFSKGDEKKLARTAHNLEKLHFLLSVLLNRVEEPDQTIKLSVTLIGDAADFNNLGLRNLRWQQGPYPKNQFPSELYYDPREDGAVLATAQVDQKVTIEQGIPLFALGTMVPSQDGGMQNSVAGPSGSVAEGVKVNEVAFDMPAEGRLYAGFAQHYLMTYFPAAYPRWYLDGFGEIFATLSAPEDGVIEYGRAPPGFREVMEWAGRYPVDDVLAGRYLNDRRAFPAWTPYRAWALAHLLFFSEEWKSPLKRYLAATASGAAPGEAAKAFDIGKLQRELATYRGRNVPFERMTYPADRAPPPIVRQLKQSEAGFVRGKLELGARVEIPPAPPSGADAKTAARMNNARREALEDRAQWLERVRRNAARYPDELEAQLLLAEGECRSGNADACLAVAERALTLAPNSASALAWKGIALAQQAVAGPAEERKAKLRTARLAIARANRADTEAILPLLGYYRSFSEAGEAPPAIAVDGAAKVVESVPSAPTPRLMLGEGLAAHGEAEAARRALLPVAKGPYESPERSKAQKVLEAISKK
jgi:hypothetical protein